MKKLFLTATIGIIIVASVVVAIAVSHFSARVKGAYFEPDSNSLRHVPTGLVILQPTHFSHLPADMRHLHEDSSAVTRTMGRDVPLRNVIAEACGCTPAHVVMPADAPEGGYDYLVTTGPQALDDLQAAVENKLGYAVHRESRVVDVWAVKVHDPNLPGLTVSPDSEPADEAVKDGKPYLIHQPLSAILDSLSQGLDKPFVDETGLTNCYDYSVTWKKMKDDAFTLATVKQVLGGWGLRLEPDTAVIDMFVAQKAR
jgi:uncharacterized protein (TIGR03435 family)